MKTNRSKTAARFIYIAIVVALVLSACAPEPTPAPPAPTQDVAAIQTQAALDTIAQLTAQAPAPTEPPPAPTDVPPPPGATPDPNIPVAVVPTPAAGEPSGTARFNTAILSGPGTNYVIYAALLGGATVKVTGKSEDGLWWVISVPPAPLGQGWVDAAFMSVTGADGVPVVATPPVPPTTEMVPPGPDDPQVTALANTYVRNGPGTNYPAYGIAPGGTTGRVIGKSEDSEWWAVRLNPEKVGAGYGWVMAEYTQASNVEGVQVLTSPDSAEPVVPPPPPSGVPTATAIDFVNIRTGPGTTFPILGVAPTGASAEVIGKSSDNGWWQVKLPTETVSAGVGWVSASWVTTQNTANIPVVASPPPPPPVGPTPPPPPATASCALISQSPGDGSTIPIGTPFTTTWVLQNTGSANWDSGEVDVAFVSATRNFFMHTGADLYDLPATTRPGNTVNISISMLAPFSPGTFGELWQLQQGSSNVLCQFWVYITVP